MKFLKISLSAQIGLKIVLCNRLVCFNAISCCLCPVIVLLAWRVSPVFTLIAVAMWLGGTFEGQYGALPSKP